MKTLNHLLHLTVASLVFCSIKSFAYFTETSLTALNYDKKYDTSSSDNDQDIQHLNANISIYFKDIQTTDTLWEEAAYLQKASYVNLSAQENKYELKSDKNPSISNSYYSLSALAILKDHLIVGLNLSDNKINNDIDITDPSNPKPLVPITQYDAVDEMQQLTIGSYIGDRQSVVGIISRGETYGNDLEGLGIEYKGVFPLGKNHKHLRAIVNQSKFEIDNNSKTEYYNFNANIAFFPTQNFGFDIGFGWYNEDRKGTDDYFEGRFNVGVSYFVYEELNLNAMIFNKSFRNDFWSDEENGDMNGLQLGAKVRF